MNAAAQQQRVAEAALATALDRMAAVDVRIRSPVEVRVDPDLPFMGYTRPMEGKFRIVLSGRSFDGGRHEGLLLHELSHVHRMETRHPSHDDDLRHRVESQLPPSAYDGTFQRETLHHLVNNVEDLYADGVAFRAMETSGIGSRESVRQFLENWIDDEVEPKGNARDDRWSAAWTMANNARAIAQLRRMGAGAPTAPARARHERLLARVPADVAAAYPWFEAFLVALPEPVTRETYAGLLSSYLERFAQVADGGAHPTTRRGAKK